MRREDSLLCEDGVEDVVSVVVVARDVGGRVHVREEGCYAGEFQLCHYGCVALPLGPVPLRRVVFVEVGETVRPKKEMLFRKGG